jgi:hypothetical protein
MVRAEPGEDIDTRAWDNEPGEDIDTRAWDNEPGEDIDIRQFLFSKDREIDACVDLFLNNTEDGFHKLVFVAYALADALHDIALFDANAQTNSTKEAIFKYKTDFDKCPEEEEGNLFNGLCYVARGLVQQAIEAHRDSSQ